MIVWPVVALVGFLVLTAFVIAMGTRSTARYELELNYLSLISMTEAFAPVLAANDGGAFVNMLSIVSWLASPQLATYSASKAAAWSYSNAARVQLKTQGTELVGVHVGYVDTDLIASFDVENIAPSAVSTGSRASEPAPLWQNSSRVSNEIARASPNLAPPRRTRSPHSPWRRRR